MTKAIKCCAVILVPVLLCLDVNGQAKASKVADSLRNSMVHYLDSVVSYDQAIALLSQKKELNKAELLIYYDLIRKKDRLRQVADSIALALAENYNASRQPAAALSAYLQLRSSPDSFIRARSIAASDSLVALNSKDWYEEYPWDTVMSVVKPLAPWIIICALIFLIVLFNNKSKNKGRILVTSGDNAQTAAFLSSIKYIRNELLSNWSEDQKDEIVLPGSLRLLPYFESDIPDEVKTLVSAAVPSKLSSVMPVIWNAGIKPLYTLNIIVDEGENNFAIFAQLMRGKKIIGQWDKTATKATLPEIRLDIAYEVLMQIKFEEQA
jgi:hypothetical protein